MKKTTGVLLALLILLSGCSSSNKYVGVWKNESCKEAIIIPEWSDTYGKCTLVINKDGTGTLSIRDTTYLKSFIGTYSIQWTVTESGLLKIISDDFSHVMGRIPEDKDYLELAVDRNFSDGYDFPGCLRFYDCKKQ